MQADVSALDGIQWRYNKFCKYILLKISFFSRYVYAVPLQTKRSVKVTRALESVPNQYYYRKIKPIEVANFLILV